MYNCCFVFLRFNLMDIEMIKKLFLIKVFVIFLIPIVQIDTSGRDSITSPPKSAKFSNPTVDTAIIYCSWCLRFINL